MSVSVSISESEIVGRQAGINVNVNVFALTSRLSDNHNYMLHLPPLR